MAAADPALSHLYLIAYDIQSQRCRYRIDKALAGYGQRVQYSLYECRIRPAQCRRLLDHLTELLEQGDRIYCVPICACCQHHRHWQGRALGLFDNGWVTV